MKTILLSALICTSTCFGAYEAWTSKDGRTAQFELVKSSGEADSLSGEFRMKNGKTVTIKAADLDEASAKKLAEAAEKAKPVTKSVFDEILEGNLVKASGEALVKCTDVTKPSKHYLFYYTASWCGPCHQYTPTLVDFYNKTKPNNNSFEVVVISWDQEEKGMTGYAVEAKMPWPLLKLSEVGKFQSKFNHGVSGIPAVVICDLEGKVVAQTRDLEEIKKLLK